MYVRAGRPAFARQKYLKTYKCAQILCIWLEYWSYTNVESICIRIEYLKLHNCVQIICIRKIHEAIQLYVNYLF